MNTLDRSAPSVYGLEDYPRLAGPWMRASTCAEMSSSESIPFDGAELLLHALDSVSAVAMVLPGTCVRA